MNAELTKILIVEDDPDILEIIRMALEIIGGMQVNTCLDPMQVMSVLEKDLPQLILLDVMMPGKDGPAVLKEIRENPATRDIPVVFLTAKVMDHEISQLLSTGAVDIIRKPFEPMLLAENVRRIYHKARKNHES